MAIDEDNEATAPFDSIVTLLSREMLFFVTFPLLLVEIETHFPANCNISITHQSGNACVKTSISHSIRSETSLLLFELVSCISLRASFMSLFKDIELTECP